MDMEVWADVVCPWCYIGKRKLGLANAKDTLSGDRFADEVAADFARAREIGVTGVPFFLAEGKLAMSGAQPSELIVRMLEQAART